MMAKKARKVERATGKQIAVWEYIVSHIEKHGYQPSLQEIADHFGVDKKAIHDRLKELEAKFYIQLPGGGKERCIKLNRVRFKRQFSPATPPPPAASPPEGHTESTSDEGRKSESKE